MTTAGGLRFGSAQEEGHVLVRVGGGGGLGPTYAIAFYHRVYARYLEIARGIYTCR